MNKSGTILCLLSIPHWKKGRENWAFEIPVNLEDKIVLSKCKDNSMSLIFLENGTIIKQLTTSIINFTSSGVVLCCIVWNENSIRFTINDNSLLDDKNTYVECKLLPFPSYQLRSVFKDKNINSYCEKWVKWRNENLTELDLAEKGKLEKIRKKEDEVWSEFLNNIQSLKFMYGQIFLNNNDFLINSLYAILRTMIFIPDNKRSLRTYAPLLFRVANLEKLPLPVFAIPAEDQEAHFENSYLESYVDYSPNLATTQGKLNRSYIIDLQEWLESPVFKIKTSASYYRIKDIIFDYANTYGSHSDIGITSNLVYFQELKAYDSNIGQEIVKNVTEVVIELGEYIIREFSSTK